MIDALECAPSPPWVLTGSGRLHYYLRWTDHLPAKLKWNGEIIGEIQRGALARGGRNLLQQVVMPPSVHPDTGARYRWIREAMDFLCEPIHPVTDPLPALEGWWLHFLKHEHWMRELEREQHDRDA
jgi:hypothetical protein